MGLLGLGAWALVVGGAASPWEELLSAILAQLCASASMDHIIGGHICQDPSVGETRPLTRSCVHTNTYLRTCSN